MSYAAIHRIEEKVTPRDIIPRHHPARREIVMPAIKIRGVTGVILAGGTSSRMGSNKALLLHQGGTIIERIYRVLAELFAEVILVTNTPELYQFVPCRKVPDIYPGKGVMAGIHAGLSQSREPAIFVVACDMPHLKGKLIRHLTTLGEGVDIVMPVTAGGLEPLHALYRKECLPALEEFLRSKEHSRVVSLFSRAKVRKIPQEEIRSFDVDFSSFDNINTPDDYRRLRMSERNNRAVLSTRI